MNLYSYILRLSLSSNALGPFDVTVTPPLGWSSTQPTIGGGGSSVSNLTRQDLKGGIEIGNLVGAEPPTLYTIEVVNTDPDCAESEVKTLTKVISVSGNGVLVTIDTVYSSGSTIATYVATLQQLQYLLVH